jgi:proline iminopeptidase
MRKSICKASILLVLAAALAGGCTRKAGDGETGLWPEIEPYETGYLEVSRRHEIYYELCGNPRGRPVFVLHGGPGAAITPYYRRFFDPDIFHMVLHDQRGTGRSKPYLELEENTTRHLVGDIEKLRVHLGLGQIIIFGGSWGSTLALAYGEKYPENVAGMILRGIFTATDDEMKHYYCGGAGYFFPETYEKLRGSTPSGSPCVSPDSIYRAIVEGDDSDRMKYSVAWVGYESGIAHLEPTGFDIESAWERERWRHVMLSLAVIENYYMANRCFLEEGELLDKAHRLENIPITMVNGRYDMICPPIFAFRLHERIPHSKLVIAEKSGHSMDEKEIERALLQAVREFE